MKTNPLSTKLTPVIQLVVTLTLGALVAQPANAGEDKEKSGEQVYTEICVKKAPATPEEERYCKMEEAKRRGSTGASCSSQQTRFDNAMKDYKKACTDAGFKPGSKCVEASRACEEDPVALSADALPNVMANDPFMSVMGRMAGMPAGAGSSAQMMALEKQKAEFDDAQEEFCGSIRTNTCHALQDAVENDYIEEGKSLEDRVSRAQDDMDRVLEKQQKAMEDLNKGQMQLQQRRKELDKNARETDVKFKQMVADQKIKIQADRLRSTQEAQAAIQKLDDELISLDDSVMAAQAAVTEAENEIYVTCRAYAAREYQKVESERKRRIEEESALLRRGVTQNQAMTSLAGYKSRQAKRNTSARNTDYNAFFNDCQSGKAPEGADARRKLANKKLQVQNAMVTMEKKRAQLTQRRLYVQQQIMASEVLAQQAIQNQETKIQQDYSLMIQNYNDEVQNIAQEQYNLQNQNSSQMGSIQQQMMRAQQRLQTLQNKDQLNTYRKQCSSRKPKTSRVADKQYTGILEAAEAANNAYQACQALQDCYSDNGTAREKASAPSLCTTLQTAVSEPTGEDKGSRGTKSGKSVE